MNGPSQLKSVKLRRYIANVGVGVDVSLPAKQTLIPFRAPARLARFPQARPLVGRARDLERVVALVERGERLITLLGSPGIGKTSLATSIAERLSLRLPGWFCDLSNQRTAADLCVQIMTLLGESGRSPADVGEALAALGDAFCVLDNFEQLTFASATLLEWSHRAPGVVFLVTSRERLAVDRECVVELEPLAVPDPAASADAAIASEAVQLFRLRAEDAGARPSDDLRAITEIVRRLDGIPLAIELAAARTRLLSPAELAKRLRSDVLSLAKRSPARHKTLADALAWSWDLLSEPEQRALACCSVFAGSFTVQAAEQVVERAVGDGAGAIDRIAALREKSLIHVAGDDRLGLYLSIREFAAQKLATDYPDLAAVAAMEHARIFARIASSFTRSRLLLTRVAERSRHGSVRPDADNLVGALTFLERAPASAERSEARAELASGLTFLGALPAEAAEGPLAAALEDALPAPLSAIVRLARQQLHVLAGRFDQGLAEARVVIEHLDVPPAMRAAALVRVGIHQREDGDALAALATHERAATLLPEDEPSPLRGINTACLGRLMCDLRELEAARRLNGEAADLCERIGERWLAALGRANLAQLEQELGHFERAEAILERAILCFREAGEPQYEGFYAAICGGLYFEWGRHDLARHWYASSERPIEALSRAFSQVVLHGGWAALEALDGDSDAALRQLELARRNVVRCPGALARVLMELHGATVEIALGLASEAHVHVLRARADELASGTSADAIVAQNNLDTRFALRILERALSLSSASTVLRVGVGGSSFTRPDERPVDLSRRSALRRLVDALTDLHARQPGAALDVDALFARGWPGERIQPASASTRVRVAIATLRKLGLRDVLLTSDDGYLFDPNATITRED